MRVLARPLALAVAKAAHARPRPELVVDDAFRDDATCAAILDVFATELSPPTG